MVAEEAQDIYIYSYLKNETKTGEMTHGLRITARRYTKRCIPIGSPGDKGSFHARSIHGAPDSSHRGMLICDARATSVA